jgi:hypothetical protein
MSQDNTKYFVIAGAVAAASLVGYYFYSTSSKTEVKKKEEKKVEEAPKTSEQPKPSTKELPTQKLPDEEEEEKILTDYENEKLLIKFQHSNTYKVEHIRKEMDEFIQISHRNKKKDLKIFMEELHSGFEEFINKSCESLQEANPIFELKKTPIKVGKHNEAFKIEYLTVKHFLN